MQRFIFNKPDGLDYKPGQGVDLALDLGDSRDQWRSFTPPSLSGDEVLQFVIKAYPDHDGLTERFHHLSVGEQVLIKEPVGTIQHKGSGAFIAGGCRYHALIVDRSLSSNWRPSASTNRSILEAMLV